MLASDRRGDGERLEGAEDHGQPQEDQHQGDHRQAAEVEADQKPQLAAKFAHLG